MTDRTRLRDYVRVLFRCCSSYRRIYINAQRTAYVGHCPRCGLAVSFSVVSGGDGSPAKPC